MADPDFFRLCQHTLIHILLYPAHERTRSQAIASCAELRDHYHAQTEDSMTLKKTFVNHCMHNINQNGILSNAMLVYL